MATCRLSDRIGEIRPRVAASPHGFGLVVSEREMVLGRLRRSALEADEDSTAEAVMEPGPSTVRLDTAPGKLAERLDRRRYKTAVVTTPDGTLAGIVRRSDLGRHE